jgi:hypothetical protein
MLDVRRRCAQTARISLHFHQCQRAIVRQKTCDPPIPWRIPSRLAFRFSEPSLPFPSASARHRRVSASVRGYLRRAPRTRKSKKHHCRKFFAETGNPRKIWWLAQENPQVTRRCGNFLAAAASRKQPQAEAGRRIAPFGISRTASRPSARPR